MSQAKKMILPIVILISIYMENINSLPIGIPPNVDIIRLNKSITEKFSWDFDISQNGNESSALTKLCRLRPKEKGVHATVMNMLEFSKLIEYTFTVHGYDVNPLDVNNTWNYKPYKWSRVASSHGQTILNLAFNYGILSLMTLSFGIAKMPVVLEDLPSGCLGRLGEEEKVYAVMDIVLRDLDPKKSIEVYEGQSSVCHQYIQKVHYMAKFTDRCCYQSVDNEGIDCITDIPNRWLSVLDILLGILTISVFLFGPMMIPDWFYTAAMDTLEYYVKLKEPLYKKLAVCRREIAQDIEADRVIDLRNRRDFQKCRRIIAELPDDMIIPIKISQFDINVNYRKLLVENSVPVGMIDSISRAVFLCKIRELDAFKDCCDAKVTGCLKKKDKEPAHNLTWITVCNLFGRFMLVFFVPFPFYIRLVVYYMWENPEIMDRHEAASNLELMVYYNFRLIQFLTPTHPIYLTVYMLYFLTGFTIAYFSGTDTKTQFQQGIMDAFQDMKDLSMLKAFEMLISNCLWPFKQYGIFGLFIGVILWPLLLPVSTLACSIYCIPLIFVSCRIVLHTFSGDVENRRERYKPNPQTLHADQVLKRVNSQNRRAARDTIFYCSPNFKRFLLNSFLSIMTIATLYSAMLVVAEIITFVAEIMCFTMMGIIVNAANVLKYGTLLFLVVIYSIDCYSNVNKKYLKLNKAIFSEIKYRLGKDIEQYTQLPSHIQENRGFKAAEASDQAEYESIDNVCDEPPFHWEINDLILFIDKDDTPRIPKKLFEDVCQINSAGAPGPVYRSLMYATRKFLVIILFLVFVFIVVLSFGESYKMSSTNQMLATMAGGFMPFMFRNIFKPGKAEVETQLLSFKSKLEEIIKNFCQNWPMYEFVFDIEEEPKSDEEKEEDDNEKNEDGKFKDSCECICSCAVQNLNVVNEHDENNRNKLDIIDRSDAIAYDSKPSGKICCSKHANSIDKQWSSVKSNSSGKDNDKKDKDKKNKDKGGDKKDKDKKDKKGGGIDWLTLIMRTKSVHVNEIKDKIDAMLLEPAEGSKVDILIYVSDIDQEWNYDDSITDFDIGDKDIEFDAGMDSLRPNGYGSKANYISLNNLEKI